MARILIVDAQPTRSESLRAALTASRHEVMTATTAQEALGYLTSHPPAVALFNLDLPGTTGIEGLSQLRAQAPRLPLLVLTDEVSLDMENRIRELGVTDLLRRGLKVHLILAALNRVLQYVGSPASTPAATLLSTRPPSDTAPCTILVVDDEPANRQLFKQFLTRKGYLVETASTGEEALAMIQQHPPDLVLLDLYMPGMNGVEVLRRLTAPSFPIKPPPGVIVATASVDEPLLKECLALGVSEVLLKPLDLKQLELAVTVALILGAQE